MPTYATAAFWIPFRVPRRDTRASRDAMVEGGWQKPIDRARMQGGKGSQAL